ncbi:MAG: class 1 fructose-bisphosphatase [Spirosomataceae bacterium]
MKERIDALALPVGTTLDRFIKRHEKEFSYASGELSQLLRDIALAGKILNREINRAGLIDIIGADDERNPHGEVQQKLDVIANIRMIRALTNGGEVCGVVTEEDEGIIHTGNKNGKYVVALDPLDGSSNIDVNVSVGTIFSIYRRVSPVGTKATLDDFLQGGRAQVAAGYILYGSSTILFYTTGNGVNAFTLENSLGEFFLSHKRLEYPKNGELYSANEGYYHSFPPQVKSYLTSCKLKEFSGRYIGSLVADFHRNMFKGGIYLYPPIPVHPTGKLRLLYECYPLAFVAEQANGLSTDGTNPTLDIPIEAIHQKCPYYVGSAEMIENLLLNFKFAHKPALA